MASRWPTRLLCAGLALWYGRFGLARRRPRTQPRRILVAHHLLLGDTIMLAPLLKKLREQFPDAEIVMTCRPAFLPLFETRPYGVSAVPFDPRDVRTFLALFSNRGFDLALLPADNRFGWLARALDARWIIAFGGDRPAYKNWLADALRDFPSTPTAWGDLAALLIDGPAPQPYRTEDWPAPVWKQFDLPQMRYCVMHLGASTPLKLWEPGKWRHLADWLESKGYSVVLSAGPSEASIIDEVDPEKRYRRFAGNLDLPQLWRLLVESRLVVCPDTGIAHLARIADVPVVVIFGGGSSLVYGGGDFWRNSPESKVTIPNFPCRNENVMFRRKVPWAETCARTIHQCSSPRCMRAISVDMVKDAVSDLLDSGA